jgi:hypothetical protein
MWSTHSLAHIPSGVIRVLVPVVPKIVSDPRMLTIATTQEALTTLTNQPGGYTGYCAQSIMGATEKRRESGASCRGIGGIWVRGGVGGRVYQDWDRTEAYASALSALACG